MGNSQETSERAGKLFAEHDNESMQILIDLWGDDHTYSIAVKQRMEVLKQVLNNDLKEQDKINTRQQVNCEQVTKN